MTSDSVPEKPQSEKIRKTLLQKYEIPLSHLDFNYVNNCSDISEIDRIVRILRSGEEGHYPQLLDCAEKRLKLLCPDHKSLRTSEPIMTKSHLNPNEWESLHNDIMDWKQEIDDTDNNLNMNKNLSGTLNNYPDVRRPVEKCREELNGNNEKEKKVTSSTDYDQWDKFDADKECLKLDLEEEKRAEEKKRRELAEKKKMEVESSLSLEEKEIQQIAPIADSLSLEERKVMSVKEKELGNEFYKRNLFKEALKHYTRSIYLHPNAVSYNNRAATYLKQCRFTLAQQDLNIVLSMDPKNVKAHFRRALTLQHKNEFQKALDDILFVLKHEPNHFMAKHIANELRANCCKLPKIHRLRTTDINDPKKVVYIEVTDEEFQQKYKDKKDFVEVNHLNIPKIMCNCKGKHINDPLLCKNDPLRYQHIRVRYGEKADDKIAEMKRASKMLKGAGNSYNSAKKSVNESTNKPKVLIQPTPDEENKTSITGGKRLEIVELEKIEEEEDTSKIYETDLNPIEDNYFEQRPQKSCLVTDHRLVKTPKTYFGNYREGDREEGKQEEAASLTQLADCINEQPKTKEEKMSLNNNLKEFLDLRGGGDADFEAMAISDDITGQSISIDEIFNCQLPINGYPSSEGFTDEELPNEITVDIHGAEVKAYSCIDSLVKEVFPNDNLKKCDCGNGFLVWSSQFESKWLSVEKSLNALEERSKLIRLICPHRLSTVVSSMLNEDMLSGFIDCLQQYFDPTCEAETVKSYLAAIANLKRFKIIYCFLSNSSRTSVKSLLKRLNPVPPELEEAFV